MTALERALWLQAKTDYTNALAIAREAWASDEDVPSADQAVQAAAATVLLYFKDLQREKGGHQTAPTAVKGDGIPVVAPSTASVAVPACPACGSKMYDNRGRKKNPKGPDFTCSVKTCLNDKGFRTGLWEKDVVTAGAIRDALDNSAVDSYTGKPAGLEEDESPLPWER